MTVKQFENVHISAIKVGDTVIHNGHEVTVGKDDLKLNSFTGWSLFGDSYRLGYLPVTRIKGLRK